MGQVFEARTEGERHHCHETILEYVQKTPDDIQWETDKRELDEMMATKKESWTRCGMEGTDFGQSRFGQSILGHRVFLAKANFGQSNFGQSVLGSGVCHGGSPKVGPRRVGPRRVGPEGWGPGWSGPRRVGAKPRKSEGPKLWGPEGGAPKGGAPKGGAPKGGARRVGPRRVGARRVAARRVGAQNFALFFPSPATVFILFSLSFGLFRGILVVFEAPGPSNVRVWSSRVVVCEPRRPGLVGPPGFHTTARELQTCTFEGPGLQKHHQNSTKKTKREGKKNKNCGGRGKKRAKFWAVRRRGVRRRGVRWRGPEHPPHTQQQHRTTHCNNTEQHTATTQNNT